MPRVVGLLLAALPLLAQDEIAEAAKSPHALAAYVESHPAFDWKSLWKVLGVTDPGPWVALPCREDLPCEREVFTVAAPQQRNRARP